jgi:hypothetical protein
LVAAPCVKPAAVTVTNCAWVGTTAAVHGWGVSSC